jgi:hypothetical protein
MGIILGVEKPVFLQGVARFVRFLGWFFVVKMW